MHTTEEIVEYLMAAMAEASALHYQAKGEDAQDALFYIIKGDNHPGNAGRYFKKRLKVAISILRW